MISRTFCLLILLIVSACSTLADIDLRGSQIGFYTLNYKLTIQNENTGEENSSIGTTKLLVQKGNAPGELTLTIDGNNLKAIVNETGFDIPKQPSLITINGGQYPFEATGFGVVKGRGLILTYYHLGIVSDHTIQSTFEATGNR